MSDDSQALPPSSTEPSASPAPDPVAPTPSTPAPSASFPVQPAPDAARGWEVACHLAGFSGYLTGVGWILGPMIVWLLKRSEMPGVDAHGKEALNYQISILIYAIVIGVSALLTCGLTAPLFIPLAITHIVLMIVAAIKVSNGEPYRYPLTIRLVT